MQDFMTPAHVAGNTYLGHISSLTASSIQKLAAEGFSQVVILCNAKHVSYSCLNIACCLQ